MKWTRHAQTNDKECGDALKGTLAALIAGGSQSGLLFGVNEKLLTQHISGLLTKYKLLYVSNQGRVGAWARVRVRAKG